MGTPEELHTAPPERSSEFNELLPPAWHDEDGFGVANVQGRMHSSTTERRNFWRHFVAVFPSPVALRTAGFEAWHCIIINDALKTAPASHTGLGAQNPTEM